MAKESENPRKMLEVGLFSGAGESLAARASKDRPAEAGVLQDSIRLEVFYLYSVTDNPLIEVDAETAHAVGVPLYPQVSFVGGLMNFASKRATGRPAGHDILRIQIDHKDQCQVLADVAGVFQKLMRDDALSTEGVHLMDGALESSGYSWTRLADGGSEKIIVTTLVPRGLALASGLYLAAANLDGMNEHIQHAEMFRQISVAFQKAMETAIELEGVSSAAFVERVSEVLLEHMPRAEEKGELPPPSSTDRIPYPAMHRLGIKPGKLGQGNSGGQNR